MTFGVREVGETRWGYCYHLNSKEEAEGLVKQLTDLEAELAEAKKDAARLRDALKAIRAVKPYNMACDHWSRNMGLEPDDVFDLCDAAMEGGK